MHRMRAGHLEIAAIQHLGEGCDVQCAVARRIGVRDILRDERLPRGQPTALPIDEIEKVDRLHLLSLIIKSGLTL